MDKIEKRLIENGKILVKPVITQISGILCTLALFLLGVILFESTIAEWSGRIWGWLWRLPYYPVLIYYCVKFFKAGLEPLMGIGFVGVPRIFGRPISKLVYVTGRHWTFPGKGNTMALVDMRSQQMEVSSIIYSKDKVKMKSPMNLNFYVYDPHIHINIKDFVKTFQALITNAFLDISSTNTAEKILDLGKNDLLSAVKIHLEAIPPSAGTTGAPPDYRIESFGITIDKDSIAVEGFDFFDDSIRQAFELKTKEEKEREGQKTQWRHYLGLAKAYAKQSGGSFEEAFLRVLNTHDEKVPDEKIIRLADFPKELAELILSFKKTP